MLRRLTDRSGGQEDKRRLILDAAVRVFARKGYHTSRVGDIAEEAGVAHGLIYHYFSSKEEVLETIFRETWAELLDAVREVTRSPQLQNEIGEIVLAFQALERIIERGKAEGSFRADLDSRLAAAMVYGALEEILTGWVMGQLPDSDEDVAAAERAVAATFASGLA